MKALRDPRFVLALKYLENRDILWRISLLDLAAKHKISSRDLGLLFRRYLGLSFGCFRRRRRMAEAIRLLRKDELSIKQIAFCLGYSAPSNFVRDFKLTIGKKPSQLGRHRFIGST